MTSQDRKNNCDQEDSRYKAVSLQNTNQHHCCT